MAKVYLSPAYHRFNPCAVAGCDETTHNNLYLDELEVFLTACGIQWRRGPRRTPNSNEDGDVLMRRAVAESDAWGAEVHYVSHTNASGNTAGEGTARGYRPIIFQGSQRGERLAVFMLERRREVYDGQISLNRRTDLYELRMPKAVTYYEEHVFHDNVDDAQWFHANLRAAARSAAKGLCDYFSLPFVEPYTVADPPQEEETPTETAPLYRVQVGAYRNRSGAESLLEEVRAAGFPNAFITTAQI